MNKEFNRGDVIMVNLGVSGKRGVQGGNRPCVVISNNTGNKFSPVLIVCPLTSRVKKMMPTHFMLTTEMYNIKADSIVLAEQIHTVSKDDVVSDKPFFSLNQLDMRKLNNAIAISIDLMNNIAM